MRKIPCLMLAYHDFPSIQTTLECLLKKGDVLDLIVVENKSESTDGLIKPYILELLRSGKVSKYFLFHRNIWNNAVEVVLESGLIDLAQNEYFMLTDGDLWIADEPDWLAEEINILDHCPEVAVCGINLDLSNLPLKTFPEAVNWLVKVLSETELYDEAATGPQFLLLRSEALAGFLDYRKEKGLRVLDHIMYRYCCDVLGRKWVRTKHSTARHLAWDRYQNPDHPYTKMKIPVVRRRGWQTNDYSGFHLYATSGATWHVPVKKIVAGHVLDLMIMCWPTWVKAKQSVRQIFHPTEVAR
jgi:hypothetical protein